MRRWLWLVPALLGVGVAAATQIPDSTLLASARADRLSGLYAFETGEQFHVTDLRDQSGDRSVLSITEYGSGRLRGLYPNADGTFDAGSAWFRREPIAYSVRFDERDGPAHSLTWTESGRTRVASRVPMVEHSVTINHGDVVLAGTLALPPGRGPHPAIVVVPGSGPLTRRTQRYVGDLLVASGVAVLTTDKRGTGGSSGAWSGLSHGDWAADVNAELDWLKQQPGIDATRIGLYAGSEGGFVAPVVAAARPDVRLLVCRVCSALPHGPVIVDMETGAMRRRGVAEDNVRLAGDLLSRLIGFALDRTGYDPLVALARSGEGTAWRSIVPLAQIPAPAAPYWDMYRGVLTVVPREHYSKLKIPVLAILGERDERLLVNKHQPVFESVAAGGAPLTLWVVPGASHGMLLDESTVAHYPEGFHLRLAEWVRARLGAARGAAVPIK